MPYCVKDPKRDHNFDNHPYGFRVIVAVLFFLVLFWDQRTVIFQLSGFCCTVVQKSSPKEPGHPNKAEEAPIVPSRPCNSPCFSRRVTVVTGQQTANGIQLGAASSVQLEWMATPTDLPCSPRSLQKRSCHRSWVLLSTLVVDALGWKFCLNGFLSEICVAPDLNRAVQQLPSPTPSVDSSSSRA